MRDSHFRHFRPSQGSEEQSHWALFVVDRMPIPDFRRFRQDAVFFGRGQRPRLAKKMLLSSRQRLKNQDLSPGLKLQRRAFTEFSVFLQRVSSLNPRVRTNFVAFPIERTRREPRSSVRFGQRPG